MAAPLRLLCRASSAPAPGAGRPRAPASFPRRPGSGGGAGARGAARRGASSSPEAEPSAAGGAAAVVIGWMGAKRKHVERVSSVWSSGPRPLADSVSVFQPSMRSIADTARRAEELREFAGALRGELAGRPREHLFIHAMSNNGFFFLANLLHEVNAARRRRAAAGRGGGAPCCFLALGDEMDRVARVAIVIDSAPSRCAGGEGGRGGGASSGRTRPARPSRRTSRTADAGAPFRRRPAREGSTRTSRRAAS